VSRIKNFPLQKKEKNFSFNFADVSLPITRRNSIEEDFDDL